MHQHVFFACGSIVVVRFQKLHKLNKNLLLFVPEVQNNEDSKNLTGSNITGDIIKFLPHTVLLKLEIVHLGLIHQKVNHGLVLPFLATVDKYQ